MSSMIARTPAVLLLAAVVSLAPPVAARASAQEAAGTQQSAVASQAAPAADVDAFMARVLERRDEAWRKLHDYVLDETERFNLTGPGTVPLYGMKRDYTWFVKEGFLIRSPLQFDGVALNERERRDYENDWLERERQREIGTRERAARKQKAEREKRVSGSGHDPVDATRNVGAAGAPEGDASLQDFVDQRGEPRFISEAYFMRFKFEPGNYYVVGRESLGGREVIRIEYYPQKLFTDDEEHRDIEEDRKDEEARRRSKTGQKAEASPRKERKVEIKVENMEWKFNKVAMVTLWVDPVEHQIVKYTFDNMDFGFLPGRWLVRVDEARASMTMARVLDGVWLPSEISMKAGLSFAHGPVTLEYGRRFSDYKKAEVGARIRSFDMREQ